MTKVTFVACIAVGGAIACRGATTTDAKENPRASVSTERADPAADETPVGAMHCVVRRTRLERAGPFRKVETL